ncbi:30S ribosomal protein S8 [Candidatus Sneabacter namystus]|uniref:Small ribosomal subunit protein uS8 n=1 Tax=Candidatus Sneabacter namystus TaxID=2601646 RepID=A0A5C0UJ48_9RICK|nr:30S ribosomal protein S8 [Candidatus Sneabacter namystus]QEK39780.1 30S ribosomal protein S8 [Candidatus Sneabacter namystus]
MISDPLADMLTRIRNAQSCRLLSVCIPFSKLKLSVLNVLLEEGYLKDVSVKEEPSKRKYLVAKLKYFGYKVYGIKELVRISKSGRRVYSSIKDLEPVKNGLGVCILSTSKGVMSDRKAHELGVGGEVLCKVF